MRTAQGKVQATVQATVWIALVALLLAPGNTLAAWLQTTTPAPQTTKPAPQTAKPAPQTTKPPAPPAKKATTQPAAPASLDGDWPRNFTSPDGGRVVLYEPQVASWENQKKLVAHAAVAYTPKGTDKGQLGTIMAEATTRVSVDERLVDFSAFEITQANFPNAASKEEVGTIVTAIKASIPERERIIGLDRVLAYLDASHIRPKNIEGVKADPPVVFYNTRPSILVNLDGDPIWSPIDKVDLRYAVNTNWDLFEHQPSKTFYLRHEKVWMKAAAVEGPWGASGTLPASFSKLPAEENWKEARATVPAAQSLAFPAVFVSTRPAELILLRGEPVYQGVEGTKLLWVSNTESDVFRHGATGPVYYLVAGRWFSAPSFNGPWKFASLELPEDFKRIPLEHERSRVLASVPGTVQAAEAVLLAEVPQTARVNKKELKAPDVAYQGDPNFEAIPSTTVTRAVNTDKDIFKVGDLYYMCFQGVWFVSRAASGPWEVSESVPSQIYEIPVSSPAHHVTYVTVEDDDDDDEWVTFATAAAYTGVMVAWGCAVWGTGYYYPPYVWYGGYYPAYFPYYPTYGYSAWYNPWTGAYGRGFAAYGPYGGAGVGARYNPRTGTYARGAVAYGPYGARGAATAYNPRTGTSAATRQGSSVYGSWGSTAVRRGDEWATTARTTNRVTGNTTRVTRTDEGGTAVSRRGGAAGGGFVGETGSGDVYAGRDGNVYRKQGDSWQKYDNGSWGNVPSATPQQRDAAAARAQDRAAAGTPRAGSGSTSPAPSSTVDQLNRDSAARRDGAQRSSAASSARSAPASSGARGSSYRPAGGARGGGGRRR